MVWSVLIPFSWLTAPYEREESAARSAVVGEAAAAAAQLAYATLQPAAQALADLPACVNRNLERVAAISDKFTLVTARQVGKFRHGKDQPWRDLSATQVVSPRVPAIFWGARCGFMPPMGLRGYDCRVGGKGCVDWRFWGWLPALAGSGPLTDRALMVRWLAEAPGYPQALLPSPLLRWEAVPSCDNKARAVLTHHGITVSGVFNFDKDTGLVESFRSDDYVRPLPRGGTERRTWVVRYSDHKSMPVKGALGGGKLVPTEYAAYRVEPSGQEYCYVTFRFISVEAE